MVSGTPRDAQTPTLDECRSAPKPCIRNLLHSGDQTQGSTDSLRRSSEALHSTFASRLDRAGHTSPSQGELPILYFCCVGGRASCEGNAQLPEFRDTGSSRRRLICANVHLPKPSSLFTTLRVLLRSVTKGFLASPTLGPSEVCQQPWPLCCFTCGVSMRS